MFEFQGKGVDSYDEGVVKLPIGIYEESVGTGSEVKNIGKIGTVRRVGQRTFVFSKAGGTGLTQGKLCIQATPVAAHQNVAVVDELSIVGSNFVTVTLGATLATLNQYEDGYLVVSDADGEGTAYKIKSNPAADVSATLKLTLYDNIHEALVATSEVCLIPNPYNGVVISITDQADVPAGVPINGITADYYFWLQTGGICSVLSDETVAQGKTLTIGSSVAGAVEMLDAAGELEIGKTYIALVDEEYRPIYLTIKE